MISDRRSPGRFAYLRGEAGSRHDRHLVDEVERIDPDPGPRVDPLRAEPSHAPESVRSDISAFLTRLWRDGALVGRSSHEAFFVECDEESGALDAGDSGRVVAVVGVAPVKPADLDTFEVSLPLGDSDDVDEAA